MSRFLTILVSIAVAALGAVIGAFAAFWATFYGCVFIDWANGAKGGGDSIAGVGWIFCLWTVPSGFYHGGYLALVLYKHLAERRETRRQVARSLQLAQVGPDADAWRWWDEYGDWGR